MAHRQRHWLQRIANQTKAITIVDREEIDDDVLFFRRVGGVNRAGVGRAWLPGGRLWLA